MLKDLISNAAILITFLYLTGEALRSKRLLRLLKKNKRFLPGIFAGFLGCLLMVFGFSAPSSVIVDMRQFALILIAMEGGLIPSIFASIIMSAFRILYFGLQPNSVLGAEMIIVIGLICGLLSRTKLSENKKWILMNICSGSAFSIFIMITLRNSEVILHTLLYYWLISIITAFLVSYLSKHIALANDLFLKYKNEASKDFLTGLDNVRRFDAKLNRTLISAKEKGHNMSILMLDIDFFKKINDTYGHVIGDEVLKELADLILKACKNAVSISRVGGEEFCIILQDLPVKSVRDLAERIRKAVEKGRFTSHKLRFTISIGIASYPDTITDLDHIVEEADRALYISKRSGRNKVTYNESIGYIGIK